MSLEAGVAFSRLLSLLLLAAPLSAQIPVHGGIVGSGGPLPGVEVTLHPITPEHEDALRLLAGAEEADPVDVSMTDAAGRYRLVAPGPGMWRVRARLEGTAPMTLDLVPLIEEAELPEATLSAPRSVRIQLLSDEGQPVSGGRVLLFGEASSGLDNKAVSPQWAPARQLLETGPDGYVVLAAPEEGRSRLEILAGGFLPHEAAVRSGSSTVRLSSAPRRTIEVVGSDRRPADGAVVHLEGFRQPLGRTDARGRLEVGIPAEGASLRVLASDGAALEALLAPRQAGAGERPDRLQLGSATFLEGRVVGLPAGEPVSGALAWYERAPAGAVRADQRGVYRLPVRPWFEGGLRAAAPGYLPERLPAGLSRGVSEPPALALHPGSALVGLVLDSRGRPLRGAEVRTRFDRRTLEPHQFNHPFWQRQTGGLARSDDQGRFRLGNLAPGLEYELRVELGSYPPERVTVMAPETASPGTEVRIVLQPGIRVFGRVMDAERQPVPGAQVTLGETSPGDVLDQAQRMENPLPRFVATTDRDGMFETGPLAPGSLDLGVEAPGFVAVTVRGLEVAAADITPVDLGIVVLSPEAVVRGQVVGPEGEPLAGAAITIVPEEALLAVVQDRVAPPADAFSGGDGEFQLGGLRDGQHVKLRVELAGYALAVVRGARAGGDPVTVVLDPVRDLTGAVSGPDGAPVSSALVRIDPLDFLEFTGGQIVSAAKQDELWDETGDDGRFHIEGVAPGLLEVVVEASGWQTWQRRLDPWEGRGDGDVEVMLRPAAVVTGVVTDAGGQPAVGAEIRRWAPPLPEGTVFYEAPLATTDGDGRYRIDDLPPGRARLEARNGGSGRSVREIEALAGENLLDFQLEAAASVSGVVVDRYGSPVAGARVVVRSPLPSWVPPRVVADAVGRFEIPGLSAGRYALEALKRGVGRSLEPLALEVRDEPVAGLVLEMAPTGTVTGRIFGVGADELAGVKVHAGPLLDVGSVDYEGSYRISDLSPGSWTIVAEITSSGRRAMGRVELDPEDPEARLDLDLGGGFSLDGVVTFGDRPWAGSIVTAYGPGGVSAGTRTDENGWFQLQGLAAGDYLLEVFIPERDLRHRQELTVHADETLSITVTSATDGELAGGQGADGVLEQF